MKSLEELRKIREKAQADIALRNKNARIKIIVGMGTSGIAAGAREVLKAFVDEVSKRGLNDILVTQTGEKGLSSAEPVVDIVKEDGETVTYGHIDPDKVKRIIDEHIIKGEIIEDWVISKK